MLNMVKHDLLNFFRQAQICEQCLQNFFNINKAWVNNSQAIRYYEGGCRNFVIEIRALKIKKIEVGSLVLKINNYKHLLKKICIIVLSKYLKHFMSNKE